MNKKSNAWILCPSKSFPGKFYYFNVITGDAAWCLNEEEQKSLAKDATIKKVSDKSHSYPEPNTPPTEDGSETANVCYNFTAPPNIPLNYHMGPPQIFGQPVFARYIPNQYMPGYVMPIPQMYVANKPEPKKRSFDQITQTSDVQVPCVQGFTIPLSKRFGTYKKVKIGTKTFVNKGICTSTHTNRNTTSNKINWWSRDRCKVNSNNKKCSVFGQKFNEHNKIKEDMPKYNFFDVKVINSTETCNSKIIKAPTFTLIKGRENKNLDKFIINNTAKKTDAQKPISIQIRDIDTEYNQQITENNQQVTKTSAMDTNIGHCIKKLAFNNQNSTVNKDNWVQSTKCENIPIQPLKKIMLSPNEINETGDETDNAQAYLNSSDLRFVLQAKRRKLQPMDTSKQANDLSTTLQDLNNYNKLKENPKQVTFNLLSLKKEYREELESPSRESEIITPGIEDISETISPTLQVKNISYLKSLAKPFLKKDPWFLVVDIGVLLDDFEFIEEFVKKDSTCRLLVPNSVRSYIETMSVGEYAGRSWVMLARKAMRQLATHGPHIVLQRPAVEQASISAIDGTIECCFQVLESNHAVLITTDTELYNTGVSSGLHTFKLDDIKQNVDKEEVSFTLGKINVKIENDNFFKANYESFDIFTRTQNSYLTVNDSDIFKIPTNIKKTQRKCVETEKIDTTTPMMFDKSNIFTETSSSNKINFKRRVLNVTAQVDSDIEDDIKLLSLHDSTIQNNKLSDNSKSVSQRYSNSNLTRIVNNTNISNDDNVDKLRTERQRKIFEKITLNPATGLRNAIAEPLNTSEFTETVNPVTKGVSNKLQNTNISMTIGHRQKINSYTIEDLLKGFRVKDAAMSQRIESRLDEWICCFYQIMEDCLSDILMKNARSTHKFPAPWSLSEAALCIKDLYSNDTAIKTIVDKLCNILSTLSDKHDNLKNNIKSVNFMRLFGCGVLLVESLKNILPLKAQVLVCEELLSSLLRHVQDPTTDVEVPYTPMRVVRSEIDDMECLNRNLFPKKPSEIIEYLMKHFPAWKDFDEKQLPPELTTMQKENYPNERTVFRTVGKNLKNIKINHAQRITFDNASLAHKTPDIKDIDIRVQKDITKIIRTVDNTQTDRVIVKVIEDNQNNNDLNKHVNKILSTDGRNNEKKLTKNVKNHKDSLEDNEILDYEEFAPNYDNYSDIKVELDDNVIIFGNDNDKTLNDEKISLDTERDDKKIPIDDDKQVYYDSTNDSAFENQSFDVCSFIRLFLTELSSAFKLIYTFIDDSIQKFRCDIQLEDKKGLYDKANETHLYVADIIGKLKRIIEREAADNSQLKALIINAGVEAFTDKRMTRYRQVIMKCLEQAHLLEAALSTMLALTNDHCDIAALDLSRNDHQVPYFNIFE